MIVDGAYSCRADYFVAFCYVDVCAQMHLSPHLDSEVSLSDEVEDELEDVLDELDDEELGLDGDPEVRLGPLNRATLLNALPR